MSKYQSHLSFAVFVGIAYAVSGVVFFQFYWEHALLAMLLVIIAESFPDVDADSSIPARELAAFLAVIAPVALLEFFPYLKSGGMTRIALVLISCYLLTRILMTRWLQQFTNYRGMMHSIPSAVISFEISYLVFNDLYWKERMFLATAVFTGFISHLLLDASGNIDVLGKAVGKKGEKESVLKFVGNAWGANIAAYIMLFTLGWFVMKDFYPNLAIHAKL